MREHLGEDFSGTVSAVTTFGVFVTLDAMFVEGLIHITELGGDYFRFDEVRQELRGERTGIRYAIGARVRVQVSRVDLDGRKIDFRWVQDAYFEENDAGIKKIKPNELSNSKSPSLKKSLPAMGKATYSRRGAKTSAAKSVKTVKKIKKR
jgi:DNA-directed RNA polymerase subunit E'/Rpb7